MLLTCLRVTPNRVLNAHDEEPDTIVQDMNGIDHIVTLHNDGTLYWSAYSEEDPEPDDGFYFHRVQPTELPQQTAKKPKKCDIAKAPRQPTAYNLFLKQKLRELSKTHGHLSNKERMKMASLEWKSMK